MTTADATRTVAPHEAQALRRRVHLLVEEEYLRLRGADRPELLMMNGAGVDDGIDPDVVDGELDVVDRRVAALERHFAALAADPSGPASGRVVLLDLNDGPQLMLVSAVAVADDQVIAADSPLGRALRDAVPGDVVSFRRPGGLGQARVLAVEPPWISPAQTPFLDAEDNAWYSLPPAEVLVGFDGSPSSRSAIAWAAEEAARRARPLRLLHARPGGSTDSRPDSMLTEGIELAAGTLPSSSIRASAVAGDAGRRLAERAGAAELLVLGRGGEGDHELGPVAQEVLNSAARATVVVPPRPEPLVHHRVVVGLHDSFQAEDALAVGFAEAKRRGAELVVTVIRDAAPIGSTEDTVDESLAPAFHAGDEGDAAEADHLPLAVNAVARAYPGVEVTTSLRTGHFAEVLVELSHSADLVVLGMGGRPTGIGRKDLLIASHSTCPVIVVRESATRGGD